MPVGVSVPHPPGLYPSPASGPGSACLGILDLGHARGSLSFFIGNSLATGEREDQRSACLRKWRS
eukprot:scaffold1512_cov267-Pinguiococcus_pyrenoidosus.AAC.1